MMMKLFAAGFVLLAATGSLIITGRRQRGNSNGFRIRLGVVLLCCLLLFFLLR